MPRRHNKKGATTPSRTGGDAASEFLSSHVEEGNQVTPATPATRAEASDQQAYITDGSPKSCTVDNTSLASTTSNVEASPLPMPLPSPTATCLAPERSPPPPQPPTPASLAAPRQSLSPILVEVEDNSEQLHDVLSNIIEGGLPSVAALGLGDRDSTKSVPFLFLECTVPLTAANNDTTPNSSGSSSSGNGSTSDSAEEGGGRTRSFTVVHDGRFYEVQTPPGALPGEVINVVVYPESLSKPKPSAALKQSQPQRTHVHVTPTYTSGYERPLVSTYASNSLGAASTDYFPDDEAEYGNGEFSAGLHSSTVGSRPTDLRNITSKAIRNIGDSVSLSIASVSDAIKARIWELVVEVNRQFRVSQRAGQAKQAASRALEELNARTRIGGMTLLEWVSELLYYCNRRLGTLVSVAIQINRELAIGHKVGARVSSVTSTLEPYVESMVVRLQGLDSRLLGGRLSKLVTGVRPLVPGYLLERLPDCMTPIEDDEDQDIVEESVTPFKSISSANSRPTSSSRRSRTPNSGTANVTVTARRVEVQTPIRASTRTLSFSPSPSPIGSEFH